MVLSPSTELSKNQSVVRLFSENDLTIGHYRRIDLAGRLHWTRLRPSSATELVRVTTIVKHSVPEIQSYDLWDHDVLEEPFSP